ncbi:hypothetical protein ACFQS7_29690 [Dankookia sp. GCM10030260]|uniref:hypothetical protein n=1 Tax=Dankookia sp. GCM10030260 TaxID=3273390 RepID=UPI003618499B
MGNRLVNAGCLALQVSDSGLNFLADEFLGSGFFVTKGLGQEASRFVPLFDGAMEGDAGGGNSKFGSVRFVMLVCQNRTCYSDPM